jgi:hypothetical protein
MCRLLTLRDRVVTQFTSQKLTQFLVQGGKKFEIPAPTYDGISDTSDITAEFCENQFEVFGDRNRFSEVGGWSQLQKALSIPMVLVMSIWDDVSSINTGRMQVTDSVGPALCQHALARFHLPPGEGGHSWCCSRRLSAGFRRACRCGVAVCQSVSDLPPVTMFFD